MLLPAGIIYGSNDFFPPSDQCAISRKRRKRSIRRLPVPTPDTPNLNRGNSAASRVPGDGTPEKEDIRLGGLAVHAHTGPDLQNATLDAMSQHMDALKLAKIFKKTFRRKEAS